MNVTYRREMKHNYLIIEPEDSGYDSYEVYMMAANGIEGLLKFRIKQVDNRKYYYYEITSKQPLNRILEYHSLGAEELRKLIGGIAQILGRLEVFLLQEKQILLEPEYIYVEPEKFTVYLCLIPGRQGGFPEEMTELLRYILGKVNHQDKECVVMAYGLYQESLKENYGMKDLLEVIGKSSESAEKSDDKIPELEDERKLEDGYDTNLPYPFMSETEEMNHDSVCEEEKNLTGLSYIRRMVLIPVSIMFSSTAIFWLSFGMRGIRRFWYVIAAAGILSFFAVRLNLGKGKKVTEKADIKTKKEESHDWQLAFEERISKKEPEEEEEEEEEILQTVLLTGTTKDNNIRYLRAVGQGMEDIAITYVPYIIGKQEGLVDHVLNGEAVSRIHARIDRDGVEYCISDLNSTNGTTVNGRLLETNETVALNKGDEVFIANFAYIFT